jgi:hypothetical protein
MSGAGVDDASRGDRTISESTLIAGEIEVTRDEMSETIDAIQGRLDPDRLSAQAITTATEVTGQAVSAATEVTVQARDAAKEVVKYSIDEAKTAVRELATQASGAVRDSTIGRVEQMASDTRNSAQGMQSGLLATIKQNPLPAALAAIGVGWLWAHRAQDTSQSRFAYVSPAWDDDYSGIPAPNSGRSADPGTPVDQISDQAKQMAVQVLNRVQGQAGQLSERATLMQDQAGQIQHQAKGFWEAVEENPLAVGAIGALLGGVVGLLLPETEQEQQLMGQTRDRVVGSMQQVAGQTAEKVQQVAKEAARTAADEAQHQGIMPPQASGSSPSLSRQPMM